MFASFEFTVVLYEPAISLDAIMTRLFCPCIGRKLSRVIGRDFVEIQIIGIKQDDIGLSLIRLSTGCKSNNGQCSDAEHYDKAPAIDFGLHNQYPEHS